MLPRIGSSKLLSVWIQITLIASVLAILDGGWLASWMALAPSRIWRGELWRLASWVFVERGALCLIVTCLCIYRFGGELVPLWGERRLRRYLIDVLGGAALAASLLAFVSNDVWYMRNVGGWAVCDALVIAYGRQYPDRVVTLYGLVGLNGKSLIRATMAITVLFAMLGGPVGWLPELLACAAASWYPTARLSRPA